MDIQELEDVQLSSSSISFVRNPFCGCDRLIELPDAAGFPSNITYNHNVTGEEINHGGGVPPPPPGEL